MVWNGLIGEFYHPFHEKVTATMDESSPTRSERILGTDPVSGKVVLARVGKFGPLVQIGESDDPQKRFASMGKGQLIESLTLEDALKLFQLPRILGVLDSEEVLCSKGRFGPYIKYKGAYISLPKGADPMTFTLAQAQELIAADAEKESKKHIREFPDADIQVLNGRYGPYIKHAGENFKIPRGTDAAALTLEDCLKIVSAAADEPKKSFGKYSRKK